MSSPRVAYILLWFPEPSQTFVLEEVNTLVRLGLEVRVYTLYGPRPPARIAGMAPGFGPGQPSRSAGRRQAIQRPDASGAGTGVPKPGDFCGRCCCRRWRSLETAGEALWAALAGVHLARRFASRRASAYPRPLGRRPGHRGLGGLAPQRHPLQLQRPGPGPAPPGRGPAGEAGRGQPGAHQYPRQ